MVISTTEAAAALHDVERTDRRTRVSGAYHHASPHLILWGLVWAAGYSLCGLVAVDKWGLVWLPLILFGIVGATVLGLRAGRSGSGAGFPLGKSMTLALAVGLFMGSVYFIFQPAAPAAFLVFPALITALLYVLLGGLAGLPRFVAVGAAIFLISMGGFVYARPFLAFWIAAAGGGGLILGGLWMRKI